MNHRATGRTTVVAVALGLLMLCVGAMSTLGAAAASPLSSGSDWAYGRVVTINFQGTSGTGWAYQGSATYGFSAILNESNDTGGFYTVSIERAMGAIITVHYCHPSCKAATISATVSVHVWEVTNGSSNLTIDGSVSEGTVSVPAIALVSSTANVSAGIREAATYLIGTHLLLSKSLAVNVSGSAVVRLTPPLGLLPLTLVPGSSWNSTSAFHATGVYNWTRTLVIRTSGLGTGNETNSTHGGGAVNRTGNVSLSGTYASGSTVAFGKSKYPAVNLTIAGPFAVRDGLLLLPAGADVFAGSAGGWASNESGYTAVSDTHLDVGPSPFANGRFHLLAAGSLWRGSTVNPVTAAIPTAYGPATAAPGAPAIAPAADSASPTYVQAQPESLQEAQADQRCLTGGVGCPTVAGTPSVPLTLLLLAGGVAAVGALAAAGVATRRRVPAPTYPNSALYPPGIAVANRTAPSNPPPASPAPATPEEDPLGHLW